MWVLLERGDAAIVPSPSYPIHIYGPLFAGADLRQVPMRASSDAAGAAGLRRGLLRQPARPPTVGWPKPRVLVISFPHNPTGACVDLEFMQRVVDFCREHEMIVVHDFAYADVGFDGYQPPSILQAEGAKECAVELYSMTKSFSMAGWRVRVPGRQRRGRAGAGQAQELPRLRHVPADPDRRHRHDERGGRLPEGGLRDLREPARTRSSTGSHGSGGRSPSRAARCSSGRRSPSRTPRWTRSSSARCSCATAATSPLSPGVGFGPGGEGFVRFALIENEQRIAQASATSRRGLPSWVTSGPRLGGQRGGAPTAVDAAWTHDRFCDDGIEPGGPVSSWSPPSGADDSTACRSARSPAGSARCRRRRGGRDPRTGRRGRRRSTSWWCRSPSASHRSRCA